MGDINAFEQLAHRNAQGPRDAHEINDRDVPLTAFDRAGVVAVNAGKLSEPLLRKAALQTVFAYRNAQVNARIVASRKSHVAKAMRLWRLVYTL